MRKAQTRARGRERERERERVITGVVHAALLEIRVLASNPEHSWHPDGHLAHIRALADVCHNLPHASTPQAPGEYDGIVWTWQRASAFQKQWLRSQLVRLGADLSILENAPRLPKPATAPDTRPSWKRWQFPRHPSTFTAVSTATLVELTRQARRFERPSSKTAVREAYIEWILEHLAPQGRHVLRPSRLGETIFVPDGPDDLRQYRALLTMCDGALIVDHPRLCESAVAALSCGLGLRRRYQLAAVPERSQERDAGLWARAHRELHPECRDWTDPAQLGGCPYL